MSKDCLYPCGCVVVVLLNVVFLLVGIALIAAGGLIIGGGELISQMAQINLDSFIPGLDIGVILNEAATELAGISTALIIMGAIVLVISLLGMCGACCKSKVVLIVYLVLICIILLAQIILVAIYYGNKSVFDEQAKKYMKETIKKYKGDNSQEFISVAWGMLNLYLQCCGVEHGNDFNAASDWNRKAEYNNKEYILQYPMSCCISTNLPELDDPTQCATAPQVASNYNKGCYTKLDDMISQYLNMAAYVVGGICGAQAALIIIVVFMIICLKDNKVSS